MTYNHGPWIDVHSHPGQCFLGGLPHDSRLLAALGGDRSVERISSARDGELSVVNASTVADLLVIGPNTSGGIEALREFKKGEARQDHDRQLESLRRLALEDGLHPVLGPQDIKNDADGSVGVFISCEGGDFLEGDLAGLQSAYDTGVRSVTLVHYRVNELGDIQTEAPRHGGLTGLGREVVTAMNGLGMIVDLAHATMDATAAAVEVSTHPVMISHSHLAGPGAAHPRLLSVEHAKLVSDAGGLIGAWPSGVVLTSLDDYCEEICRMVEVIGIDHVAIGSDLDANYRPVLTDYKQFPELAQGLERLGMSSAEVDQIMGGNFIRLFETVCAIG